MKKIILLCCVVLTLCGCVEVVDIDTEAAHVPLVNCILTTDTVQTLTLTYARPHGQDGYEEIIDATATLYRDDQPVGQFQRRDDGVWTLSHKPIVDGKYRLSVQIPGEKELTATTTFPRTPRIIRKKNSYTNGRHYFEKQATHVVWAFAFQKPEDIPMMRPVTIDPEYLVYKYINSDLPGVDHFNQLDLSDDKSDLTKHFMYLRILPDDRTRQFYLEELYSCIVVFRGVSDEYDRYMKSSIAKMMVYFNTDDPTQWLDENEIYTNITNGLGIFGAYHDLLYNCNMQLPN